MFNWSVAMLHGHVIFARVPVSVAYNKDSDTGICFGSAGLHLGTENHVLLKIKQEDNKK